MNYYFIFIKIISVIFLGLPLTFTGTAFNINDNINNNNNNNIYNSNDSSDNSSSSSISNEFDSCPCAKRFKFRSQNSCRSGLYIDYYYNAPYSGYPANSTYSPSITSAAQIILKLTEIRNTIKSFLTRVGNEGSSGQRALFVKNNFDKVQFILQAIDKAANVTTKT